MPLDGKRADGLQRLLLSLNAGYCGKPGLEARQQLQPRQTRLSAAVSRCASCSQAQATQQLARSTDDQQRIDELRRDVGTRAEAYLLIYEHDPRASRPDAALEGLPSRPARAPARCPLAPEPNPGPNQRRRWG